ITRELDDQQALEIIERKLSNLKVAPPHTAWGNIVKELEGRKQPALVVPMHHGWLKYAAAACFLAIISVTAFFILNGGSSNKSPYTAGSPNKSTNVAEVQTAMQDKANQQPASTNRQQQALDRK